MFSKSFFTQVWLNLYKTLTVQKNSCIINGVLYYTQGLFLRYKKKTLTTDVFDNNLLKLFSGGCRTAATSKMELFVVIGNGWKPLTIITQSSILNVAAVLDPRLVSYLKNNTKSHRLNYFSVFSVILFTLNDS